MVLAQALASVMWYVLLFAPDPVKGPVSESLAEASSNWICSPCCPKTKPGIHLLCP